MFGVGGSSGSSEIRVSDEDIDAQALAALREFSTAALAMPREGDTFRFGPYRGAVEIVAGFRPGIDRVVVFPCPRVLTTEETGHAVVIDAQRRRIVLEGVTLAELMVGDVGLA